MRQTNLSLAKYFYAKGCIQAEEILKYGKVILGLTMPLMVRDKLLSVHTHNFGNLRSGLWGRWAAVNCDVSHLPGSGLSKCCPYNVTVCPPDPSEFFSHRASDVPLKAGLPSLVSPKPHKSVNVYCLLKIHPECLRIFNLAMSTTPHPSMSCY